MFLKLGHLMPAVGSSHLRDLQLYGPKSWREQNVLMYINRNFFSIKSLKSFKGSAQGLINKSGFRRQFAGLNQAFAAVVIVSISLGRALRFKCMQ